MFEQGATSSYEAYVEALKADVQRESEAGCRKIRITYTSSQKKKTMDFCSTKCHIYSLVQKIGLGPNC